SPTRLRRSSTAGVGTLREWLFRIVPRRARQVLGRALRAEQHAGSQGAGGSHEHHEGKIAPPDSHRTLRKLRYPRKRRTGGRPTMSKRTSSARLAGWLGLFVILSAALAVTAFALTRSD